MCYKLKTVSDLFALVSKVHDTVEAAYKIKKNLRLTKKLFSFFIELIEMKRQEIFQRGELISLSELTTYETWATRFELRLVRYLNKHNEDKIILLQEKCWTLSDLVDERIKILKSPVMYVRYIDPALDECEEGFCKKVGKQITGAEIEKSFPYKIQ